MIHDSSNNTAVELNAEPKYSSDQELGYSTDQSRNGTIRSAVSEPKEQNDGWFENTRISKWFFGSPSHNNNSQHKDYY